MPPKAENPLALYRKAIDLVDSHRFGEAESALDKADEKNLSADPHIMCARAYWSMRSWRLEEAARLALAVGDSIIISAATSAPGSVPDHDLLSIATFTLQQLATPECSAKLMEVYEKVLPHFQTEQQVRSNPTSDKSILESFVHVCACAGKFKEMQKHAQELNRKSYKDARYTMWMVFAFLMQIPNRKTLSADEAAGSLQYKLALRTLEGFVAGQVASKEKQQKDAALLPTKNITKNKDNCSTNSNTNSNNNNNNNKKDAAAPAIAKKDPTSDNVNSPAITPAVAVLFVDVLLSQQKFDEAIDFLLDDAKGKFFGSWSERVKQVGVVLRRAKRTAEANSIFRHLLHNFDSDRWDVFEEYRDTALEVAASANNNLEDRTKAFTYSHPVHQQQQQQHSKPSSSYRLQCEQAGVSSRQELVDDLVALNNKIVANGGKSRAPRLGAISLLSAPDSSSTSAAVAAAASSSSLLSLRTALLQEHVKQVGVTKSVLFFDLVKYVTPADAEVFDQLGAVALAGYCRRFEMSRSDDLTTAFVNKCLESITSTSRAGTPENEDDAVKCDVFVVAAISACLRRHRASSSSSTSTSSDSAPASAASSSWLRKATAVASYFVRLFGINAPHITFLSTVLHKKIGSSDLDSVRALDIKAVQHDAIVAALHIAVDEHRLDLVAELTSSGAMFYKHIDRQCNNLIESGLKNTSFLAFEEVFETKNSLMTSCARIENIAIDALVNEIYEKADTVGALRNRLLLVREDLVKSVLAPQLSEVTCRNEDRVNLFAVCLHEEPRSVAFTEVVDFLVPSSPEGTARRVAFAKAVAAVLVTLEIISGESAKYRQSRLLSENQIPSEVLQSRETQEIFGSSSSSDWLTELARLAKENFAGNASSSASSSISKQKITSGIESFLKACGEYVVVSSASSEFHSSRFFFPVLQLMILCVRVLCDRQSNGVKAFVSNFRQLLQEEVAAKLEQQIISESSVLEPASVSAATAITTIATLDFCESLLQQSVKDKQLSKLKRELEIVQNAIKMLVTVEKLTK